MAADCTLNLYTIDKRLSDVEGVKETAKTFTNETAHKAGKFVASYFDVKGEWDRRLMDSAILDVDYNRCFFNRKDAPYLTSGIRIDGDQKIFSNTCSHKHFEPLKQPGKVSLSFRSERVDQDEELDYERIGKYWFREPSVVALFNSESYQRVVQCSTHPVCSRTLEKID